MINMLADAMERLKTGKKWISAHGTIHRVFEMHDMYEKDESGQIPVYNVPEIVEKKISEARKFA
jgi:hypothetical protein